MYLYNLEYIISSYALTTTTAALIYDTLITMDKEVDCIWKQKVSFGTLLYLANRYMPFIDTLIAYNLTLSKTTPAMCQTYYQATTWLIAVGLMISEFILLMRTWALWERQMFVLKFFGAMSAVTFTIGIVVTQLEIQSLRFAEVPEGGLGCNLVHSSRIIVVAYFLIATSETVVVYFTLKKGFDHLRGTQRSWVTHVYRNGLIFYLYLLCMTIINIVVPLVAGQPLYKNYLAVPQRVFHSIFCNRVILQIQGQRVNHDDEDYIPQTISKTNFTGNIVLDSAIQTNFTIRDPEYEHELRTYRHGTQDWTER